MLKLLPSVLSADFAYLADDLKEVEKAGVTMLHVDVMDGHFVPAFSIGFPVVSAMRKVTDMYFDVHLMLDEPERYLQVAKASGADRIGIHVEIKGDIAAALADIRGLGCDNCLVINPETPIDALEPYLDQVDCILVMGVHPGFGGQSYIPETTSRIRDLKARLNARGLDVPIEVDGGVKTSNVREIIDAGATQLVAGSAVFNDHTYESARAFMELFAAYN